MRAQCTSPNDRKLSGSVRRSEEVKVQALTFVQTSMSQPVPVVQIVEGLADNLRAVLSRLCTQRYGGPISLRCTIEGADSSYPGVRLQIEQAGCPVLDAAFAVRHFGGNMYDIQGTIEGGPSQVFSYCLSESSSLPGSHAPRLTQEMATFLLDALERQQGSEFLRTALRRPSAASERSASVA